MCRVPVPRIVTQRLSRPILAIHELKFKLDVHEGDKGAKLPCLERKIERECCKNIKVAQGLK